MAAGPGGGRGVPGGSRPGAVGPAARRGCAVPRGAAKAAPLSPQLYYQVLNFAMIVSSALMIWKGLIVVTGSESPIVVVLRWVQAEVEALLAVPSLVPRPLVTRGVRASPCRRPQTLPAVSVRALSKSHSQLRSDLVKSVEAVSERNL